MATTVRLAFTCADATGDTAQTYAVDPAESARTLG